MKNIALLTGGYSSEAVISYKSGKTIYDNLDKTKYNVYLIDISRNGWFYEQDGVKIPVNRNDFSLTIKDQSIHFDAVYIGIHGTPGEDGKLQGYFDMLEIPYTSCDCATSALTFNKRFAVGVAKMSGAAVANSILLFKSQPINETAINSTLNYPLYIKPNNGGSSIGMSKIDTPDQLSGAIEKAFNEDTQVLVEEMIKGREFTIGVFKTKGEIIVLPITEVKAHPEMQFFDFEAKYEGKSTETTPADINDAVAGLLRGAARNIYEALNCSGVVRMDFIFNEEKNTPYLLEVNTVPGQSSASIIPQQVAAMGWKLSDFYTKIIEECWK